MQLKATIVGIALILGDSVLVLGQVNLPEGFEIVEFGVSEEITGTPSINNCGQIVYRKDRNERSVIYLYDNGAIRTIAESRPELMVGLNDINDAGTIVWWRGVNNQPDTYEIVMLKDGKLSRIGRGAGPSINNNDLVSVHLFRKFTCQPIRDILLYDGKQRTRITRNQFNEQSSDLNDDGWIVWGRSDSCVNPWVGWILLYRDGRETILPSDSSQPAVPSINNAGQVVWDAGNLGIEMWDKGRTIRLIENGHTPRINNLGDVYFLRFHEENNRSYDAWLYRVSTGEPTFHRLTDEDKSHTVGDINDWAEVAWRWMKLPREGDFSGGVRFLRRIRTGDTDLDGDIDLTDHAVLVECMTGPGRVDRLCDCRFLDVDHDGDVDLGDFARFQNGFTGE